MTESRDALHAGPDDPATGRPPASPPDNAVGPAVVGPFTVRHLQLIAISMAAVLGLLFLVTRPLGEPGPVVAVPTVGAGFYAIASPGSVLKVGDMVPDFVGTNDGVTVHLTDLQGQPLTLAALRGHPLWVNFWATWCPPCQQETPNLEAAVRDNAANDLVFLAIDVQEPASSVADYAAKYGLTYRIGLDTTGAIFRAWGIYGLPTHFFIDRSGVIRSVSYGPLRLDQIEQRLVPILAH